MKKFSFLHLVSFFILFSAGAWATQAYIPELKQQIKETYITYTNTLKSERTNENPLDSLELEIPDFRIIPPIPEGIITKEYDKHLFAGESNGFGLIEDKNHLEKLIEEKSLVSINKGAGYEVMKLTHSHPYITPYSKIVLEELGFAFQTLTDSDSYFMLTSVTRTPEQQNSLRKRNRNATSGESSHSYGVSFDISYIRFNGKKNWNGAKQKKLEKILTEFQDAGKILFIKERKQSCYHVTIR